MTSQPEQLKVRAGHIADNRKHDAAANVCGGKVIRFCSLIQATDTAPEVGFPTRAGDAQQESLHSRKPRIRTLKKLVFPPADVCGVVDGREVLRSRLSCYLASLFHARRCNANVVIVGKGVLHELFQVVVIKKVPPWKVR